MKPWAFNLFIDSEGEQKKVKTVLKCWIYVDVDVVRTVEASHTLLLVTANEKSGHLTEQY